MRIDRKTLGTHKQQWDLRDQEWRCKKKNHLLAKVERTDTGIRIKIKCRNCRDEESRDVILN